MKRLLTASLTALALVGCASIPTSGPVSQVTPSQIPARTTAADLSPGPPIPGASADEMIAGFQVAMAAGQPGLAVARKYLTPQAAESWHPEANGVQIYDAEQDPPQSTADNVQIDARILGRLDPDGRFKLANERVNQDFKMVRVDGELRISNPPEGLLISQYMFTRYFDPYPVYFLNSHGNLVPETVHLPISQVTPELVLKALLAGPSSWLAGGVSTALPADTKLNSVALDPNGTTRIDLGDQIARLGEEERRTLGAQLAWTMSSFPRVKAVLLTVNGAPYKMPGQSDSGLIELVNQQGFQVLSRPQSPDLFAISNGILGRITDEARFVAVKGEFDSPSSLATVGLSLDAMMLAAVDTTGTILWLGATDGQIRRISTGLAAMARPQVALDRAWTVGKDTDGRSTFVRIDEKGQLSLIRAPDIGEVISFRIDPAGSRIAMVGKSAGKDRLWLAKVDETGIEPGIVDPIVVPVANRGTPLDQIADVVWTGESALTILATDPGTERQTVYTLNPDGADLTQLGPVGELKLSSLTGMPRKAGTSSAVTTTNGMVLRSDAKGRWQQMAVNGISFASFAG